MLDLRTDWLALIRSMSGSPSRLLPEEINNLLCDLHVRRVTEFGNLQDVLFHNFAAMFSEHSCMVFQVGHLSSADVRKGLKVPYCVVYQWIQL